MQSSKIIKSIIVCCVLIIGATCQDGFEFNNFIEVGNKPYQVAPFPYPYNNDNYINWKPAQLHPVNKGKTEVMKPSLVSHLFAKKSRFLLSVFSSIIQATKLVVDCFRTNGFAVLVGSLVAYGVCHCTSLCQLSLHDAQQEIKSLASSERFRRATEFLEKAVSKYYEMQSNKT